MSSILDALEKSERERNQESVPQYQDMQPPEEKGFKWKWLWVILTVTCFVLLVLAVVRWWPSIGSFFNSSQHSQKNGVKTDVEISKNNTDTITARADAGDVLEYVQLSELEKTGIPDSRINVVSVSADRERSFVMLGERMYREGDAISEHVTLESIKKDHIIFNKKDILIRRDLEQ